MVVCIPLYAGHEHFVSCLRSVLRHTPLEVRVLICDDASPDPRSREHVRELQRQGAVRHQLYYTCRERNAGFPANVNGAFASAAPADLVVLNSDCVVAERWLEGLRAAAYSASAVATATALTNHGTIVSVPERWAPARRLPEGWSLEDAAGAVRRTSLCLRPRLPTAVGHCVYVRRSALELVGGFDLAFSPGYGEEVDFSQRCLAHGLCHVAADDVLVFHHGGGSLGPGGVPNPVQAEHEQMLARRYPYYHDAVRALQAQEGKDREGPLVRALGAARRALKGPSVVIDARILAGEESVTGPRLRILELIAALSQTGEARVSARAGRPEQRCAAGAGASRRRRAGDAWPRIASSRRRASRAATNDRARGHLSPPVRGLRPQRPGVRGSARGALGRYVRGPDRL